jgi:competence protein ComEC
MAPPRAPARLRLAPHLVLGAFCAGLAGALAVAVPAGPAAVATVGCALGSAALAARGRAAAGLVLQVAAAGQAGWGWGGFRLAATEPPALDLPQSASGLIVVDAPPAPDGRGGLRARAVVERMALADGTAVPGGTRILLDVDDADGGPRLGDRIRVAGRLRPAWSSASPGWWRRWLERGGIAARIRVGDWRPQGRRGGLAGARDGLRRWAADGAAAGLGGDRAALVRGMALGGGSGLSESAAQAFRDAGLWHLLAVSGQNVAVVAVAALALLLALGVRRRIAVAGALGLIVTYCLACDGGASVGRAGVVGALGLLCELRSSPRERWYLLLVAFAALLAHQPRALGDPGLQLSFAAVVGLLVVTPPLAAWARGWMPARLADLAAMAAAASLATAPVLAWNFGRLSLAGLVLNVVAVPLAAPIVVLALAGIVAGAAVPAAGVALAWLAGLGAGALLLAARGAAAIPGAAVDLPSAAAWLLLAPPVAVAVLGRRLAPGGGGLVGAGAVRAAAALGASLALAGWALGRPAPPPPWPADPAVTALDIGQGDAILLRSPEGAAGLVDSGPPGPPAPVVAALRRMGVRRLDVMVLTHDSLDHVGGGVDVLHGMDVGVLVHEPPPDDGFAPAHDRVVAAARELGVPVREARAGTLIAVGRWGVRVLSPTRGRHPGEDPNPVSLVALASAGPLDVLLTADAESDALARLPLRPVEVLKVSHHGSEDPGLPGVLTRLRPRVALVSAGQGNPFRHPRPETLAALAAAGVASWETDLSGDVTVSAPGGVLSVTPGH